MSYFLLQAQINLAYLLAAWDIENFLNNLKTKIQKWGGLLVAAMGAVAVVWGFVMLITGLMSHGKKPTNWLIVIALILVGGALMASGWNLMEKVAKGGEKTINDLGGGGLILINNVARFGPRCLLWGLL